MFSYKIVSKIGVFIKFEFGGLFEREAERKKKPLYSVPF